MGRRGKDEAVIRMITETLHDMKNINEKPETVIAFEREMKQLKFRFDAIEELRKQFELPARVKERIREIKARMSDRKKSVRDAIESLKRNQSTWLRWVSLVKPLITFLFTNFVWIYLGREGYLPHAVIGMLFCLFLFITVFPSQFDRLYNTWTDSDNMIIEGLTKDMRHDQDDLREYINMQGELRACRKFDVATVLEAGTDAAKFWSDHFGSDTATVESSRVVEALLIETDRRIKSHTVAFWDAYARLTVAKLECERRSVAIDESQCTLEQLFPNEYSIHPDGRSKTEVEIPPHAHTRPKRQVEMLDSKKEPLIRSRLRALLRVTWYENAINKSLPEADVKALRNDLTKKQFEQLNKARQDILQVEKRESEEATGRWRRSQSSSNAARPREAELKKTVETVGADFSDMNASRWSEVTEFKEIQGKGNAKFRKNIAEVLEIGVSFGRVLEIKRGLEEKDDKDVREMIEKAVKDCKKEAEWLARGDYREEYLALETKRNLIHQIVLALGDRTHDGFISPLEVEQLLLRLGSLDFLIKRVIWSCIHEEKDRCDGWFPIASASTWYSRPGVKLVSAADARDSILRNGSPGDYAVWPDIETGKAFVLAYVDQKRNLQQIRLENDAKSSVFFIVSDEDVYSYYYDLGEIIEAYRKRGLLRRPFVNPNMRACMNVSGSRFDVRLGPFLQPVFKGTKLYRKFKPSKKDDGTGPPGPFWKDVNQEMRFDRDRALFNIILNIYRYCGKGAAAASCLDAVIPNVMPPDLCEMLRDELLEWNMPFVLSSEGKLNFDRKAMRDLDKKAGKRQADDDDDGDNDDDSDDASAMDLLDDDGEVELVVSGDESQGDMSEIDDGEVFSEDELLQDMEPEVIDQSILAGQHAYEVLEGLPRFDENPNGVITTPPFTSGQQVEYFSKNKNGWFRGSVARIVMDQVGQEPTVWVRIDRAERPVSLGSDRLRRVAGANIEGYDMVDA